VGAAHLCISETEGKESKCFYDGRCLRWGGDEWMIEESGREEGLEEGRQVQTRVSGGREGGSALRTPCSKGDDSAVDPRVGVEKG